MSNDSNAKDYCAAATPGDEEIQTLMEKFMQSSFLAGSPTANEVRLKNTFIEVGDKPNEWVNWEIQRSNTCPAEFEDMPFSAFQKSLNTMGSGELARMTSIAEHPDTLDEEDIMTSAYLASFRSPRPVLETPKLSPRPYTPVVAGLPAMAALGSPMPPRTPTTDLEDELTTVMLRNIPNKYTQSLLLDSLNSRGFLGHYNFFYLPVDFKNGCNMGYAFINFGTHQSAVQFMNAYNGYQLPAKSSKICEVCWARVQGISRNVEHYRNNPVNDLQEKEFRPLIFSNGTEVPFPRPDPGRRRNVPMTGPAAARRNDSHSSHSSHSPERGHEAGTAGTAPPGFGDIQGIKIFVGGLSAETVAEDLRAHFSEFGTLLEASIVTDKKTGQSRGFGFCTFATPEEAERARILQHTIRGQSVGVRLYKAGKQ